MTFNFERYWKLLRSKHDQIAYLPHKYSKDVLLEPWTPYLWTSNTVQRTLPHPLILDDTTNKWTLLKLSHLQNVNVSNFPSEFPLPTSQVTDLKTVSVDNFPTEYPLPSTQVTDLKSVSVTNFPSEYPLPSSQVTDLKNVAITRQGTISHFNVSASGSGSTVIYTPSSGKAAKVLGWSFYCDSDVVCELRFSTSGNVIAALPSKGSHAMNCLGLTTPQGSTDETIEIYVSDAANVKGWICIEEV